MLAVIVEVNAPVAPLNEVTGVLGNCALISLPPIVARVTKVPQDNCEFTAAAVQLFCTTVQ
jgi:hypothetical protein